MYVWDDGAYQSLGVRGLGKLGSYTNRELVLADGHPTNDDWIGSAYVGYDGRTDLADLERIEVVRGPGSVLYGTNAFSGVVNLVSRYKDEPTGGEVGVSTAGPGVARARARGQVDFGKDAGVWTSVSGAHASGQGYYFPELATGTTPGTDGYSRGADGFNAGTVQGRTWWRWLTAQWFYQTHDKSLPTGEFGTLLSDPSTRQSDTRAFFEARAEPSLSKSVQLYSRLYWNLYRFRGDYARNVVDGGVEHDAFDGSWVGAEQRLVLTPGSAFRLTLGGEGQSHYRVDTSVRDDSGYSLDDTGDHGRPFRVGALYALADFKPSERLRISGGVRLDDYSTFGSSWNPRASIILHPYARGNTKIIAGKAFRAPSVYELYYNDGGLTEVASPNLRPESIYSFEIEHSHRFTRLVTGLVSAYANYARGLIVLDGNGTSADLLRYANSPSPLLSLGAEIAPRREWRQGFMMQLSYTYQHSRYLASTALSDLTRSDPAQRHVANSPEHLASLKVAAPLFIRGLTVASRITVEGPRYDRNESVGEPPQGKIGTLALWDLVLSGHDDRLGLTYTLGAYNLSDFRYSLPLSGEFTQTALVQNGRTFLASVDVRFH